MGRQPCPRFTHIADRTVWDICTHHVFTDSESGSWFNFNFLPMNNSHENTLDLSALKIKRKICTIPKLQM